MFTLTEVAFVGGIIIPLVLAALLSPLYPLLDRVSMKGLLRAAFAFGIIAYLYFLINCPFADWVLGRDGPFVPEIVTLFLGYGTGVIGLWMVGYFFVYGRRANDPVEPLKPPAPVNPADDIRTSNILIGVFGTMTIIAVILAFVKGG